MEADNALFPFLLTTPEHGQTSIWTDFKEAASFDHELNSDMLKTSRAILTVQLCIIS